MKNYYSKQSSYNHAQFGLRGMVGRFDIYFDILTQDTNEKVTNSQLDTTNESQDVSPFPAGDHEAHINRRA